MADGVAITAGSGTTILTDDTGSGGHAQVVKLAISTDGSGTLIPADATNGILVDVKRVQGVVAIGDGTDTVAVATAGADAESNTGNRLEVENYPMLFNGTTWDRARGDTSSGIWVNVKADASRVAASTVNSTSSDGGTALTNSAQAIKASAGKLRGYFIYNPNATVAYVQFYNTAQGSVTVGTTNPLFMLAIPPASAANLWMESGVTFSTAMSWSATSTAGGNGAPSSSLEAVAWYE